ncbi:MAG: hypothetical protein KC933_03195 [Myxococcales bacterium]|nr:hypothetical protein [Myxococcales bacterium]
MRFVVELPLKPSSAVRALAVMCCLSSVGLISVPAPACSPSSTEVSLGAKLDEFTVGTLPAPEVGQIEWVLPPESWLGCGGDDGCSFASITIEVRSAQLDYLAIVIPDTPGTHFFRPRSFGSDAIEFDLGAEEAEWFVGSDCVGTEIEVSVVVDSVRSRSVRVVVPPTPELRCSHTGQD